MKVKQSDVVKYLVDRVDSLKKIDTSMRITDIEKIIGDAVSDVEAVSKILFAIKQEHEAVLNILNVTVEDLYCEYEFVNRSGGEQ